MIQLELSIEQIDQLVALLEGKGFDGVLQEAVLESTALILARIRKRFLDTQAPDGTYWEPSYAAFYRSMMGIGGDTLFDTGNLFHSIQAYSVSPYEGAIGTDVPYASIHQFGEGKMPRREFLGFSENDHKLAVRVFIRKIQEVFQ